MAAGRALRTADGHRLTDYLRAQGVAVETIPTTMRSSSHRKVLVVDGERGFTGGMNVGDWDGEYSHDVDVMLTGPAVADLQSGFEQQWQQSGGRLADADRAALYPRLKPSGET